MESGLEVCHDGLQLVSALGFASLVAEFEDSIVQPPLRHTHRRTILSTDRRYVRYRTYCIFEGSLGAPRLAAPVRRYATRSTAAPGQASNLLRKSRRIL